MIKELNFSIIREDLEFIISHDLPWENFNDSTILVTGAAGFLASYMVETFLHLNDKQNRNIKIIALVRDKERALKRFCHYENREDISFLVQDVCEPIQLKKKENIDYIIHAASQASPEYYEIDPIGTLSANIIGTLNLLKIADEKNIKNFLYFSSGGVLGNIEEKNIPAKETDYGYLDPLEVGSCYSESKRMAENICVSWHTQHNTPIKIVRPSYIYGPAMRQDDERVFPKFISNIVNGRNLVIRGTGEKTRGFCYISDATLAFFTVLLKGRDCNAYNVGTEKETSILELANLLIEMHSNKNIKIIKKYDNEVVKESRSVVQRSCFDISKINQLGWRPTCDLNNGIKRMIDFYGGIK